MVSEFTRFVGIASGGSRSFEFATEYTAGFMEEVSTIGIMGPIDSDY